VSRLGAGRSRLGHQGPESNRRGARHPPGRQGVRRLRQHLGVRRRCGLHGGRESLESGSGGTSIIRRLHSDRSTARNPTSGVHDAQSPARRTFRNDMLSSVAREMAILHDCLIDPTQHFRLVLGSKTFTGFITAVRLQPLDLRKNVVKNTPPHVPATTAWSQLTIKPRRTRSRYRKRLDAASDRISGATAALVSKLSPKRMDAMTNPNRHQA
jgi:hypothetical protein